MKLFDYEGHLTAEGLKGLTDGTLDEMQRLEASEHLDFCDSCVERYALALTDDVQMEPPAGLAPWIFGRLRARLRSVFFSRFSRVAVAAVMTLVIWNGAFVGEGLLTRSAQWIQDYSKNPGALSETLNEWGSSLQDLGDGFNRWFAQNFTFHSSAGNSK